ncbi:MAG: glycosyltransferase family 2 protein [Arcticibacter sp.]
MDKISVVSPVYKAYDIIPALVSRLKHVLDDIGNSYEIILVDDGCPQNSWSAISEECKKDERVIGVKLSRNFGQHNAITAGLSHATGDWVVVMDCDLQDQPEEIPNLFSKVSEGYKIVYAVRNERQDAFLKRLSSSMFYRFFSYMTDTKQDARIANFGIYNKTVIDAILSMRDNIRYFPAMAQWVGFSSIGINVNHAPRSAGKSSYNWKSLFKLAMVNIIAFSGKPMYLTIRFGLFIVLISFLIAIYYLYLYLRGDIIVLGYSSLIISIWLLSGTIISILGVIGLYIGGIFEKVKDRPNYIVDTELNSKK